MYASTVFVLTYSHVCVHEHISLFLSLSLFHTLSLSLSSSVPLSLSLSLYLSLSLSLHVYMINVYRMIFEVTPSGGFEKHFGQMVWVLPVSVFVTSNTCTPTPKQKKTADQYPAGKCNKTQQNKIKLNKTKQSKLGL